MTDDAVATAEGTTVPAPADSAGTPADPPTSSPAGLTHRQVLVVFSGLILAMFLAALDQTIVGTALPTIVNNLHGLNHLSWVVTAYLLTSTISTPLYGKLSDQYGRRHLFQIAIVVFLVGSALAGLSQTMWQLIACRGIQGLGAGGLMALSMTIIGDIVAPRERGRYQGYTGATFALSTVAGPLLGGLITDNLSWRWIFYINIPIGIVALVVISSVLRMPFTRSRHDIDYLGTVLMTLGVSSALLVTVWGGTQYAWGSPLIIGLAASAVVLVALFALWERHAAEPILPPHLFRSGIFRVASSASFLLSMVLFGALIYMPVYLQLVDGVSAMVSGLLVIPMMAGVLVASVGSGQIVTRTGRYKIFPVVGAVLMGLGMWLLSHLGLHTSHVTMSLYLVVLGAGFGMIMQIMVLATQNAVEPTELGTATSAVMFFRSLGGAFGTSLFGAIFVAGLGHWLPRLLPASVSGSIHLQGNFSMTPAQLHAYPVAIQNGILESFVRSLHTVFLVGVPLAVLTFGITLLLKEQPLRTSSGLERVSEDVAMAGGMAGSADAEIDEGVLDAGGDGGTAADGGHPPGVGALTP